MGMFVCVCVYMYLHSFKLKLHLMPDVITASLNNRNGFLKTFLWFLYIQNLFRFIFFFS